MFSQTALPKSFLSHWLLFFLLHPKNKQKFKQIASLHFFYSSTVFSDQTFPTRKKKLGAFLRLWCIKHKNEIVKISYFPKCARQDVAKAVFIGGEKAGERIQVVKSVSQKPNSGNLSPSKVQQLPTSPWSLHLHILGHCFRATSCQKFRGVPAARIHYQLIVEEQCVTVSVCEFGEERALWKKKKKSNLGVRGEKRNIKLVSKHKHQTHYTNQFEQEPNNPVH